MTSSRPLEEDTSVARWETDRDSLTPVTLLRRRAESTPDATYLDFSGVTYTYADTWDAATHLARGLRDLGVEPGDTVASMLDNNIDGFALWLGANLIGAVWVGVNTALPG